MFRLGATLTTLRERVVEGEAGEEDKRALEILVRKIPEDQQVRYSESLCQEKRVSTFEPQHEISNNLTF